MKRTRHEFRNEKPVMYYGPLHGEYPGLWSGLYPRRQRESLDAPIWKPTVPDIDAVTPEMVLEELENAAIPAPRQRGKYLCYLPERKNWSWVGDPALIAREMSASLKVIIPVGFVIDAQQRLGYVSNSVKRVQVRA